MEMQSNGHAIMIAYPYQGHINPYTTLAIKLASKGFTVTFAHLEFVHHKLSKVHGSTSKGGADNCDIFFIARGLGLDIRYTTISDGFLVEFDREVNYEEYWESMMSDFPALADEFVGKMILSEPLLVPFLVTDTLYPWAVSIADKYSIVSVSFWTEPALVFAICYHWDLLTQKGHSPCKDKTEEINYIPGVKSLSTKDLMPSFKDHELSNSLYKKISWSFKQVKKADFILHNTVEELESDILSSLNEYQHNYAIGPISFSKNLPTTTVNKSLWSESDCTCWLESKPPGSVLYVSFGSYVHMSKEIIEELAYGLVMSEVSFIWAIRPGILLSSGDASVMPVGFNDEIRDKGLIVPWCDQIKVLSNPAVGGFLTHNGWNSTTESMWFGVPMICYPMVFDQFPNRKSVVNDWKIGISLCDKETVDRTEVAEKIKSVMSDSSGSKDLRMMADSVKDVMRKAMEIDGPSEENFEQFIKDLKARIHAKTVEMFNA